MAPMKLDDYGDFGALQFHAMLRMMINDRCPCEDELHRLAAELRTYDIAYTQNELIDPGIALKCRATMHKTTIYKA